MNKIYDINNRKYELIDDYNGGFDYDEIINRYTEYFDDYDYILGDWSYGKLRLKGFCDKDNKLYNNINDIKSYKSYIKDECAYGCKYFLLKKISK